LDKNSEAVYDKEENYGQPKNLAKNQSAGQRKESVAEKNQKPFVPLKCILYIFKFYTAYLKMLCPRQMTSQTLFLFKGGSNCYGDVNFF
jgi:hypothetical protein